MAISFETPIHTFTRYENIQNIEVYNQFLNWLKGEFDLYLMEELDGLKVYYPNGLFTVTTTQKIKVWIKWFTQLHQILKVLLN